MACKKHKTSNKQHNRKVTVMRYARALNLHSIELYQEWCLQYGFSTNLNKTRTQFEREYQQYILFSAENKLKQHKTESNLHYSIQKLYENQISYKELNNDVLMLINNGFKKTKNKLLLRDVLYQFNDTTKLLDYSEYANAVIKFVEYSSEWLRPISDWKVKSRNVERQFSSIVRYLVANYEVPVFMDSVWKSDETKSMEWFIHLGRGNNIRKALFLPISMTKKMAHYFIQAPSIYNVNSAFRWAQIHALGGNKSMADAISTTRLAREFNNDEFCISVLRFFINNPMLDKSQYVPIIDYIWNQKYENRIIFIERGVTREIGREQPNFSMHGRTATTLLAQVEKWHRQLGKHIRGGQLQWKKSRYLDYRFDEGRENRRNLRVWTISELLSTQELISEGRTQSHCVASYARSCFSGNTSIWTMNKQENQTVKKLLTIELHNPTKTIRQIRGFCNRIPNQREMDVIHRWSHKEQFSIMSYI